MNENPLVLIRRVKYQWLKHLFKGTARDIYPFHEIVTLSIPTYSTQKCHDSRFFVPFSKTWKGEEEESFAIRSRKKI